MEPIVNFSATAKKLPNPDVEYYGGKGAGLIRMASMGLPVPPGIVVSTELCKLYQDQPDAVIEAVMTDVKDCLPALEKELGHMPLLSVRSGAPVSMPGMMDTILNVGLTPDTMPEWSKRLGERAALDSLRRLLQMMGETAFHIPASKFEDTLTKARKGAEVLTDAEIDVVGLEALCDEYFSIYDEEGISFPDTLEAQLEACIRAVFNSWNNERAKQYRQIEGIDDGMGTAVVIQAMVFGNLNEKSGSGVLFSRNPSTGEKVIMAEYLANAQGEDVVAGIRTPDTLVLGEAPKKMPNTNWMKQLAFLTAQLEKEMQDMVDIEFTVQDEKLFILQVRAGKRSAQAAFRIAWDMYEEGEIDLSVARSRVTRRQLNVLLRPQIDPSFKKKPDVVGLPGSMGIATGTVVFSSEMAVQVAATGEKVILVTEETTPDDVAGMAASEGILTRTGGATSHAAVVARGMDKPCVVGVTKLVISDSYFMWSDEGETVEEGDVITIDGETGRVWAGEVPVKPGGLTKHAHSLISELNKDSYTQLTPTPVSGAVTCLADTLFLSEDERKEWMKEFDALAKNGMPLIIDLTMPSIDQGEWRICGAPDEFELFDKMVEYVATNANDSMFFTSEGVLPHKFENTPTAGRLIRKPNTVEQIMIEDGYYRPSPELRAALSLNNADAVLAKMREVGLVKAKEFNTPKPFEYVAFSVLE